MDKELTKVLAPKEPDMSPLLEVTITFKVRSSIEKLLKRTPFVTELSYILSRKGIETVSMFSKIKKIEGETDQYKKSMIANKRMFQIPNSFAKKKV